MAHAVLARTPLAPLLDGFTWPQRLLLWILWGGLLGPLILALQRRRPAGSPRLLAAVPVMALNMLAPLLFDGEAEVLSCFTAAVATSMLTNLKVRRWRGREQCA